jgi:hypothetical protein
MAPPVDLPNIGFEVGPAEKLALEMPSHSWEYGTAAQALLELHDPDVSVFSPDAFSCAGIPNKQTASTNYAKKFIQTNSETLIDDSKVCLKHI